MEGQKMIEVRWHGRGGQGAVVASRILALAAYTDGYKGVQAFPFFGMERRGAPVLAFTRMSKDEIRIRNQVYEPDVVVVLDPLLPKIVEVTRGLKPKCYIVLNSRQKPSEVKWAKNYKTATVDALSISKKLNLKVAGFQVFNTPMLGALARATKLVKIASIKRAIIDYFGEKRGKTNTEAAEIAYENTFCSEG